MLNNYDKMDCSVLQLRSGCLVGGIASVIFASSDYKQLRYRKWEENNYKCIDGSGGIGVITFKEDYCVGAFFTLKTKRAHSSGYRPALEYLWNVPVEILDIAQQETFQYFLDGVNGTPQPVITTAFWGDKKGIYLNDKFNDFMEFGGKIIKREIMDFEQSVLAIGNDYDFDDEKSELLRMIAGRRIAVPFHEKIYLTKEEVAHMGWEWEEDEKPCKVALSAMNIFTED